MQTDYLPATLTSEDYPGLIAAGQKVETVAVGAALIAFNWPKGTDRYRRIQKFVDNFFPKLAEFQKAPRHPKWREANLAAVLPGWTRFAGADEWLRNRDKRRRRPSASSSTNSSRAGAKKPRRSRRTSATGCSRNFCNGAGRATR